MPYPSLLVWIIKHQRVCDGEHFMTTGHRIPPVVLKTSLKVSGSHLEIRADTLKSLFQRKKSNKQTFLSFLLAGMITAIKQTVLLVQVFRYNYPFQTISIDQLEGLSTASVFCMLKYILSYCNYFQSRKKTTFGIYITIHSSSQQNSLYWFLSGEDFTHFRQPDNIHISFSCPSLLPEG